MDFGDPIYLNTFYSRENYIRGKGKEDAVKHSGKSMLRKVK